jgi:hypothetical protein
MPIMDEFADPDRPFKIYRTGAWSEPKHNGGDCWEDNEDFLVDHLRDDNKADREEAEKLKAIADKEISNLKVAFDAS